MHIRNSLLILCLLVQILSFSQTQTALLKKGANLFWKENYKGALKVFEKERRTNPSYEVDFWITSCHFQMKEIAISKTGFLKIVNSNHQGPERSLSLVNLGSCYRSLDQIDSAHYYYDRAMLEFPELAGAYFNKGQLLYSQDKFEDAKRMYDRAIEIDSTDWYYYMKRQEISFVLQHYEDALKDMQQAQRLNSDVDIHFNMAYCFSMLERYSEADSLYQKIPEKNDPSFLNNYGFNKHKLGDSEAGIALINKSLQLNPKNAFAYRNLAVICIDQGNLPQACAHLKEAQQLNFFSNYGSEVDLLLQKYCL